MTERAPNSAHALAWLDEQCAACSVLLSLHIYHVDTRYHAKHRVRLTAILQQALSVPVECTRYPSLVNIMKLSKLFSLGLPVMFAAAAGLPATAVHATDGPTLELTYPTGQTTTATCKFDTDSGVSVDGNYPGTMNVTGQFVSGPGSDCPTTATSGGNTGPAAINSLTVSNPSGGPLTPPVVVNDTVKVSWSATADICTYTGTNLPAPLPGWPASGNACIGAYACGQPHSTSATLTSGGTYTFGLTCASGVSPPPQQGPQWHPEQTVTAVVPVVVTGAPPPSDVCVAPPGITRQTDSLISDVSTYNPISGPLETWIQGFGINWTSSNQTRYFAWPGVQGTTTKFYINKNEYLALKFTVPLGYPLSVAVPPVGVYTPKGGFSTNASNTSSNHWALSITRQCGDFDQPAPAAANYKCFASYSREQGSSLNWVVRPLASPLSGMCNLTPGDSYYLNIIAAPLNDPTQNLCDGPTCRLNLKNFGTFSNGALN